MCCHSSSAVISTSRFAITPGSAAAVRAARANLSLVHVIAISLVAFPWHSQHFVDASRREPSGCQSIFDDSSGVIGRQHLP